VRLYEAKPLTQILCGRATTITILRQTLGKRVFFYARVDALDVRQHAPRARSKTYVSDARHAKIRATKGDVEIRNAHNLRDVGCEYKTILHAPKRKTRGRDDTCSRVYNRNT
jgi:hypothetical protein